MSTTTASRETTVECMNVMVVDRHNLARVRDAGVDVTVVTSVRPLHKTLAEALQDISGVRESAEANADLAAIVGSVAEVETASRAGRAAIVLAMQDLSPLEGELAYLRIFRDLGVRVMQLTHNYAGDMGSGCLAAEDDGLTALGRAAVKEMNRLGIAVDLSHCGERTSLDAIDVSEKPVFCSHSNPREISDSPRNKSDPVMRRLSETGGLLGIASYGPIVYRGNDQRPGLSDYLDCIEYAVNIMGPDAVCIGTDTCDGRFTGEAEWNAAWGTSSNTYPEMLSSLGSWYTWKTWYTEGMESTTRIPALRQHLAQRGFLPADIEKIMGGNALRFFSQVWRR